MARTAVTSLICLLFLRVIGSSPAISQEINKPEQLPVYIVDFAQDAQRGNVSHELGDLGTFTTGLIHLRLLEVSSVTVHRVSVAPACDSSPAASAPNPSQNQTAFASAPVTPLGDFYVVRGSIEVHLPDVVLNYSVYKCQNHTSVKLFQDTQPFTLHDALEEITSSAHAIAFKIQQAIPPTQITVAPFKGDATQQDVLTAARTDVIQTISQSSDYKVIDAADYVIGGQITFTKNPRFIGVFPNASTMMRADLFVTAHGKSYPLKQVDGTGDQLKKFYADIDAAVLRDLPQVLLAEHLQLPDVAAHMTSDALLAQAQQILAQCPQTGDCPKAPDAVQLLSAATEKDPHAWKIFMTLGQAQIRAGRNVDAATSLQTAANLIKEDNENNGHISSTDQLNALILLGDSYRSIGEYRLAEESYDGAIKIDPTQLQLYRSKAIALQFDNKRIEALETIIHALNLPGPPDQKKSLHETAEDDIRALQPNEFDDAEHSLDQAYLASTPVANEYTLVISRKWEHLFDTTWTAETRKNARVAFKKARDLHPDDPAVIATIYGDSSQAELVDGDPALQMSFIHEAEKQPIEAVPAYLRAWVYRIDSHAQTISGQYDDAFKSADNAYQLQPSDYAAYLMADATWLTTRCKEWKLKLGPAQPDQGKCSWTSLIGGEEPRGPVTLSDAQTLELKEQYRKAADRAAPLVAKRFDLADGVLMRANHSLNDDKKTTDQFMQFAQQDPKDVSALKILQHICSQYTFDFECSFFAAQKRAALLASQGAAADPGDYLDVAEAAVLKGDYSTAEKWLTSARQLSNAPRDIALFYLYQMWIAMRLGQTGELKTDFDAWREATSQLRASKGGVNWTFIGAEKSLDRTRNDLGAENTALLTSMMNVLKDDTLPLPPSPLLASR